MLLVKHGTIHRNKLLKHREHFVLLLFYSIYSSFPQTNSIDKYGLFSHYTPGSLCEVTTRYNDNSLK